MKKREVILGIGVAMVLSCTIGINSKANANYFDVVNTISNTAYMINTLNSAARGTMSTVEYGQRFQDRQQDRKDRKRSEKEYNANAEQEYYKTLQETQALRQQYYYDKDKEVKATNIGSDL